MVGEYQKRFVTTYNSLTAACLLNRFIYSFFGSLRMKLNASKNDSQMDDL